jgi:hypothetical protein
MNNAIIILAVFFGLLLLMIPLASYYRKDYKYDKNDGDYDKKFKNR